jgi:hypothetical protein
MLDGTFQDGDSIQVVVEGDDPAFRARDLISPK